MAARGSAGAENAAGIVAPVAGARLSLGVSTIVTALEPQELPPTELRCRWILATADRKTALAIPQDPGPQRDGFSTSNCSRNVRFGDVPAVQPGRHLLSLETESVRRGDDAPAAPPSRSTIPVSFVSRSFSAVGIAPAVALPGDRDVTLYGEGFDRRTEIRLDGPVYSLESPQKPLCELALGRCPGARLAARVERDGDSLRFSVPPSLSAGLYRVVARRDGNVASRWLTVESARKIIPPSGQRGRALPIYSGQTLRGRFRTRGDSSGVFWDYELFYFVATAGSVIDVSLSRVDASRSWFHPDEIDPELYVVDPGSTVFRDLWNGDVRPNSDLNAGLTQTRLTRSGLYLIVAATTKGAGEYELHYENHAAPACRPEDQFVSLVGHEPFSINIRYPFPTIAAVLDPLGRPLGDAPVNFRPVPPEGSRPELPFVPGVAFVGGAGTRTNSRGLAAARAFFASDGTVRNAPLLADPVLVAADAGENPSASPYASRGFVAVVSYLLQQVDVTTGEIRFRHYDFTKADSPP